MPTFCEVWHSSAWRDAWLMHFLPSLNPRLDPVAAAAARRIEDRIAASSGLFLTTGHHLAEVLATRYPGSRVWVCEPGIDAVFARAGRGRQPGAPGPLDLVTVGNLVPAKGYGKLASLLRGQLRTAWCWHIVGSARADPVFSARFLADTRDLVEKGRMVFHGTLKPAALAALMGRADLYLSASYFESYGMALAEAITAGCRVVTTAVGDARRLVGAADAGVVVPVGAWDQFARHVGDALEKRSEQPTIAAPSEGARRRTWRQAFDAFYAALQAIRECHRQNP